MKKGLGRVVGRSVGWLVCCAVLLVAGCPAPGSGDDEQQISLNQPYGMVIESFGTMSVRFTTTVGGVYTIAITGIDPDGDMGWEVYQDPQLSVYLGGCDYYADNSDEVDTLALSGSTTYYLVIDEWADPGTSVAFTLTVMSP